jgi:hypothetical protein
LAKKGARLGGGTGQFFLRFIGKDSFVLSGDVVACLRDTGLDVAEHPTSKKDLRKIQDQFNAWAEETGLPMTHFSRICAMSRYGKIEQRARNIRGLQIGVLEPRNNIERLLHLHLPERVTGLRYLSSSSLLWARAVIEGS